MNGVLIYIASESDALLVQNIFEKLHLAAINHLRDWTGVSRVRVTSFLSAARPAR
jgi:hypothetical protein